MCQCCSIYYSFLNLDSHRPETTAKNTVSENAFKKQKVILILVVKKNCLRNYLTLTGKLRLI